MRHDFYITIMHGDFVDKPKCTVELRATVCTAGGIIKDCIVCGVGDNTITSEWRSFVFFHNHTPKWRDGFFVRLSPELMLQAHLKVSVHHLGHKGSQEQIASAVFNFASGDAPVANGLHKLPLHKWESRRSSQPAQSIFRGELVVSTRLTTTHYSQHEHVRMIRKYRTFAESEINEALKAFLTSPPQPNDILPFLSEVLHALFNIEQL
jgi:hypothetical protein